MNVQEALERIAELEAEVEALHRDIEIARSQIATERAEVKRLEVRINQVMQEEAHTAERAILQAAHHARHHGDCRDREFGFFEWKGGGRERGRAKESTGPASQDGGTGDTPDRAQRERVPSESRSAPAAAYPAADCDNDEMHARRACDCYEDGPAARKEAILCPCGYGKPHGREADHRMMRTARKEAKT